MPDLSQMSDQELLALHSQAVKSEQPADLTKLSNEDLLRLHSQALNQERPKVEPGESLLRGAAQGATLGFSDELVGLGKGIAGKVSGEGNFGDLYTKYRDQDRLRNEAAQLDNPKTYIGGNLVGGVATSLVPGVGLAKGASALGNVARAAKLGAYIGAGTSEADLSKLGDGYDTAKTELKSFAGDVAGGAAVGAATQGAASVAGKALGALKPSALNKFADVKTLKAAGYRGPDLKTMAEAEKQAAAGVLNEKGVVKAFDSLDNIAKKAGAAKEEAGAAIGSALKNVDDLVSEAKGLVDSGKMGGSMPAQAKENLKGQIDKQFQFNMDRIARRLRTEIIEPNVDNPLLKSEMSKLGTLADDFASKGPKTLATGNVIKGTQGKVTNFDSDTVPQAFKKEVYGIINNELDDVVAKTGNLESAVAKAKGNALGQTNVQARNQSASDAYKSAKGAYGVLKQTEETAQSRLGQNQGNREISLTDTIAGGAALASGGAPAAVAVGGLNKLARQYGDSVMAVSARKAADIIERAPKALGKFASVLEQAAGKGAPSLDATHKLLMKDPDYRAILDNFEKGDAMSRRLIQGGSN